MLPTYNRASVVQRAIASVLGQTYRNLELIVVDDGSTDATGSIVGSIRDERVRYIRNEGRRGPAVSRNRGIRESAGPLVAFQDSDDEWLTGKLADQVALLDADPSLGWVGGGYISMDGPRYVASDGLLRGEGYERDLLDGQAFVTPVWLVRREVLVEAGLFNEALPCLEDWDLIFRLDALCRFGAVPGPVMVKYGSRDSVFGDEERRAEALEVILSTHWERWRRAPAMAAYFLRHLGRLYGVRGDHARARRHLWRAARLRPFTPRTYALLAASSAWRPLRRAGRALEGRLADS